jgi:hypothetical protein
MTISIPGEWWDYIEERDDGDRTVMYVSKSKTPKDIIDGMKETDAAFFKFHRQCFFVFED